MSISHSCPDLLHAEDDDSGENGIKLADSGLDVRDEDIFVCSPDMDTSCQTCHTSLKPGAEECVVCRVEVGL